MPVVLRMNGFAFRVNTHDHPPPHVHVRISGTWARITLGAAGEEPYVMRRCTMRDHDVARALGIVYDWRAHLLCEWSKYHDGGP